MILKMNEMFEGFDFLGARHSAEQVRLRVIEEVNRGEKVVLDFEGIRLVSHSFADELFGLLVLYSGIPYIKENISLQNARESIKSMANFAINERQKTLREPS